MDTDDAMGLALQAADRTRVNTDRVKAYLRLVAQEHIDVTEKKVWKAQEKRNELWGEMNQQERDTANDLVIGIFEPWL